ncbi:MULTISPECIES: ABC transporter ATP-binding protein [Ureibacillus]|uniref:ATP-binding cassette subfamily B protein n=1 Tax=Ureibacillus thermosphaericus TaxID=51173 RepID=A0A840PHX8_URETH|nr:ABC transporter ATP-binding protein [Ureibacillus thermosphaericus]MBB5148035.1 ATP-binding cassette subfamily B protein [Ureibacillus thermosphaericus]NKZ30746.1 ABC transporter ATP-binding protein [Ureibacillus thermosphaericus]
MEMFKKPFGYEPILTKEDLRNAEKKHKGPRASDWKRTLLRIWKLVDEQRGLLIAVFIMVIISSIAGLLGPFLMGYIIDHFVIPKEFQRMVPMIGVLIGVYIVYAVTLFMQNYWMVGIAQTTVYRMRTGAFKHLLKLPISYFDKRQHGEIMSRLTNDIETVSATLNTSFIQVFSSLLTLAGTIIVMLYLSPSLTLITMIVIPLMFIAMRWITKRTSKLFKAQQEALGDLNGMIEETISGQSIVKAFSQEDHVKQDFYMKSKRLKNVGFWALVYSGYIPKVFNFLNNMSFAIIAGIGGIFAYYGWVTIGTIVIFTEYARQFTRPLNDLANQINTVLSAIAGAERVFSIMDEEIEEDRGNLPDDYLIRGEVEFRNVSFKYESKNKSDTLHNLNFRVQPGQTVALVGPTGAGKTTTMLLIARFYDANSGEILIDGKNIRDYKRQTLRRQMAFVLQDPFLFEASVRENIRYGRLDATDEEVVDAAKKANAHDFIMKLPKGYDTVLKADGSEISQGQKQLLSIARAFLANPAILLLDEATSSIDTVTEKKIQEALEELMKGRTSFVIAHRLNTVRHADIVFVMKDGRIAESGSQQELIEKDGIYANMLKQSKGGGV